MKIPSRNMPKRYESGEAGNGAYFYLIGLILLPAVFILIKHQSINAVLFLVCFYGAFIALGYIAGILNRKHFKKIAIGREEDNICSFARHFDCNKIDTWVIRAVYEELQYFMGEEFPINPSDHIFEDLKIDHDDFVMDFKYDIVGNIAQRTQRSLENFEENPYYEMVNTVEDLVMFFHSQPRIDTA